VLDRQVPAIWWIEVDGAMIESEVRADLLVARDLVEADTGGGGAEAGAEERFVAEVKTGSKAPDPNFPATRRQLLEYAHVFAPYGVLLVDAEAGTIREVCFPERINGGLRPRPRTGPSVSRR